MFKVQQSRKSALLYIFTLSLILTACGGTRSGVNTNDTDEFIWPLPPDPPRIQYIKSIHSELDVGRKRSLAKRIFESIFGRGPLHALKKPLAVHTDKSGRIFVTDTNWRRVLIFDFKKRKIDILGKGGKGRILNPLGITTAESGYIYVTDAGGQRVLVYKSDGKFLTAFGGKGILKRPFGIAVNSELRRAYVVDTWAHQIKVFDCYSGKLLFTIGKQAKKTEEILEGALDQTWNRSDADGEFNFPTQIAIGLDGQIYVVDTLNFRIQILSAEGEFIHKFGTVGTAPGNFYRPKGIALDSEGNIYVTDAAFSNVQIFNQEGRLLLSFGLFGAGKADLRLPAGLFIDQNDQVFVVDQFNNRIQVYQFLGSKPKKEKDLITKKKGGEKI